MRSIDTRYFLRYSNHHKMAMLRVENLQNDRPTNRFILFQYLVFLELYPIILACDRRGDPDLQRRYSPRKVRPTNRRIT